MSSLGEALLQIREALQDGESADRAMAEAAEEFALHSALLRRKWQEQHQCTPEEWQEQEKERRASIATMAVSSKHAAQEKAREIASKWLIPAPRAMMVGRVFTLGRHEYAFAVFAHDNPKWAIRAVRVIDGRLVNFHADRWREIEPQLQPVIRVRRRPTLAATG